MRGVTSFRTSRSSYFCVVAVARSRNFGVRVAIVTGCAGMRGVTSFRTGRSSYNIFVAVTKSRNFVCRVGVAASAGVGRETSFRTSGSGYYAFIAVSKQFTVAFAALFANCRCRTSCAAAAVFTRRGARSCIAASTDETHRCNQSDQRNFRQEFFHLNISL